MRSTTLDVPIPAGSLRVRVADCPGVPILLIHGGPGGTDYLFKFFAVALKDAGYRPVGVIQRGSLGSPSDGPFDVATMRDDLECVREFLGADRVALLGHSWGGFLAATYAARYPERIERLLMICPIGGRAGWREPFMAEIDRRLSREERQRIAGLRAAAELASDPAEYQRLKFEIANIQVFAYYSPHHREGKPGLAGLAIRVREEALASLESWYADPSWEHGFARLRCPVAIIWGKDDPVPALVVDEYAELMPAASIHPLDDCGHFPWMEDHEQFWAEFERAMRE